MKGLNPNLPEIDTLASDAAILFEKWTALSKMILARQKFNTRYPKIIYTEISTNDGWQMKMTELDNFNNDINDNWNVIDFAEEDYLLLRIIMRKDSSQPTPNLKFELKNVFKVMR